ncbi:MAG: precorrin-6y C5,15-methyltransferase (decarboxylating) subunit CbiE [Clostridiales bacterium]|nr:precorrin-6y C5,15-methyltransferase (decarboxylating) subunit CbiE [Clostridiales bacterium]
MKIYIIGAGCGSDLLLTSQAREALKKCEVIIGAERIVEKYAGTKKVYTEYKAEEIKEIIDSNNADAAVLMSGDTGFFSGAKKLLAVLKDYDVTVLAGISSMTYFAQKLGMPWEDWKLLSLHGQSKNIIGHIRENEKTFALLNNGDDVDRLCRKLLLYGMDDVKLFVGERLSYEDETITSGTAAELCGKSFDKLSVILAVNNKPKKIRYEINDSEYIRGKVPMTKQEIRTLSIAKLRLTRESVLYDIGAGTGSVGIASAMISPDIDVYAFEKKSEAVELMEKNKIKFGADNVEIAEGRAEELVTDEKFKTPTHAFIGGSDGHIDDIIDKLFIRNNNIRIVVNAVSLETISKLFAYLKDRGIEADITQISLSKGEPVGRHTMMKAYNPIYIIAFGGAQ